MARELIEVIGVMDRDWEWGVADCCTAACDVFKALHDIDPMAELRGKYFTKKEAAREIVKRGGFIKMCESLAFKAKLEQGEGKAGEIGVATLPDGNQALVVAIADGVWAGKTETGFVTVHEVERSWKCHR